MSYAIEYVAGTLKAARERKGLSQREFSKQSGVPQSHISKIESGAVDLRLSSLVELARVLDLELVLVPRKSVPAVQSIARRSAPADAPISRSAVKELKRLQDSLNLITYDHPAIKEIAQLQRQVRELQRLQMAITDSGPLREANKALQTFRENTNHLDTIRKACAKLQRLRNSIVHALPLQAETVKPVYNLDEDDDG